MQQQAKEIISYPAAAGGVMTRVLEAGGGSEAVLFCHGVGARADRWRRNLGVIAGHGYRCLALDFPGHGFAQKGPSFAYGVPGYAQFVEAFIREHDLKDVHFVGTSLGAHVLGTVACRNPSLVRSLTFVGATGMFPIGKESREAIAGRIGDTTREGIRRKLSSVIFDDTGLDEQLVDEEWRINNSPGAKEAFERLAQYFRTSLDEDVVGERLAALQEPRKRMLVWGAEDRSVPVAIGCRTQELFKVPLHSIPNSAHAPYFEAPELFNQLLVKFLKQ
jgi:pimeloyl-ACP methyl ester carboxylesterase